MASIQKRTSKEGKVTYRVQVRLKGCPTETATFERITDAKKWVQDTESSIRAGRHFKTSEAKKHTMGETIDRYIDEVLKYRKKPVNQKTYLSYWKKVIGEYSLADVTPSLIVEHRNALVGLENKYGRTIGTTTANRYIQSLGHVFTVTMKEWQWIADNPVSNIKKYKEPRGRVRFLSDDERVALLKSCQESFYSNIYTIVVLALSTGARKMELLTLRWSDVDLNKGQIILHETKNGERRTIPLTGHALELVKDLKKVQRIDTDMLFPSQKGDKPYEIKRSWETALKEAGIKDFRFHDLRHSAASYLAMNGASLAEIAEVLGHKTLQMVKRYAHLSEAHTSSVVASMNERIFGDE